GNPTADETLVEVKGSELQQFLDEQLSKKIKEAEERGHLEGFEAGLEAGKTITAEIYENSVDEQLTKKEEEVETFKREAIDFILGGYPNAELMKHKIDVIKKTDFKTQAKK